MKWATKACLWPWWPPSTFMAFSAPHVHLHVPQDVHACQGHFPPFFVLLFHALQSPVSLARWPSIASNAPWRVSDEL